MQRNFICTWESPPADALSYASTFRAYFETAKTAIKGELVLKKINDSFKKSSMAVTKFGRFQEPVAVEVVQHRPYRRLFWPGVLFIRL